MLENFVVDQKKLHVISYLPYAGSKNEWSICIRQDEKKQLRFLFYLKTYIYLNLM